MKCIECGEGATAICKFCRRAVCTPHTRSEAYVTGYTGVWGMLSPTKNALRVEDAIWCGRCRFERRVAV
jgi:hypothetical protein